MGGDERRARIRQKMLELEQAKGQAEEDDDDEGLFGEEDELPVVVDEGLQEPLSPSS